MNIRLTALSILVLLIGSLGLSQCQSAKINLQKTAPFFITKSFYQNWTGGQPGNSGTTVQLYVDLNEEVQPDSLFFQNRATFIDSKPSEIGSLWVANFRKVVRRDINLTENPSGEYGNSVPEMTDFPFELAGDEAVLKYTKDKKIYYYKIIRIAQKETLFYPTARPRN